MKILGWHVPFTKQSDTNLVTPLRPPFGLSTSFGLITEAFGGMWQRHLHLDNTQSQLAFSAVYACIGLISGDIGKIRLLLQRRSEGDIWDEAESGAFSPVIRKPNRYQTRMQFIEQWLLSKLIWGNTYVLKERDQRGVVTAMYVLDSQRTKPLIAPDGAIYYQVQEDWLAGVDLEIPALPASEIIHDRSRPLFHPLCGVPPLWACALSTTQGRRIQTMSSRFFENMSRPSGQLTAPGTISNETAERLKDKFESTFSGTNIGRLLVSGDGLKFEPINVPADQAQLIEQLGWSVEDVCRAYGVPLYKVAAQKDVKVDPAMKQEYYDTTLFPYIEAIELLLDDGLALPSDIAVKFDIEELLRMDPKTRFERYEVGVRSAVLAPNEARASENLKPAKGGDTPFLQQQNWPIADLAEFHKREIDVKINPPAAPVAVTEEEDEEDIPTEEEAFNLFVQRADVAREKAKCQN